MHIENAIRDFLLIKGVHLHWVDSALSVLKQGMAQDPRVITNLLTQRVTVKQGHVNTYTATLTGTEPGTGRRVVLTLRYTFNPRTRMSHKLWLSEAMEQLDGDPLL